MTSEELEIAKKIAEIEGYKAAIKKFKSDAYECGYHAHVYLYENPNGRGFWCNTYNPFDWSILGPLMFKYEVDVSHYSGWASVASEYTDRTPIAQEYFGDLDGAPMAILKCIIKSQG
jgi:hypothetical protein